MDLETLKRPGAEVVVDGKVWDQGPYVIAGATHLPKREQLKWWADFHGLQCTYDPRFDGYLIRRPL